MPTAVYLTPDQVPSVIRAQYNGQKFRAIVAESVRIPCTAGLWDGGSRDVYRAVRLADGADLPLSDGDAAFHGRQPDRDIPLSRDVVVVNHQTFRGKDMGLTIYLHPDVATPLLPAPAEFAPYERLVLTMTATRKSSYNGRDRYEMGHDELSYIPHGADDSYTRKQIGLDAGLPYPTRAQWDAAKAGLIVRGLLQKNGAITPTGRNALNVRE